MKKIIRKVKNNLLLVIICAIMFSAIGAVAATLISSSEVSYNNTNSGSSATTVKGALDELYNMAQNCASGTTGSSTMTYSFIFPNTSSTTDYNNVKDKNGNIKKYFTGYKNGKYYVCAIVNNKLGCFDYDDTPGYVVEQFLNLIGETNCTIDGSVSCIADDVKCNLSREVNSVSAYYSIIKCGTSTLDSYCVLSRTGLPHCR